MLKDFEGLIMVLVVWIIAIWDRLNGHIKTLDLSSKNEEESLLFMGKR